jgi:hypothetical protein
MDRAFSRPLVCWTRKSRANDRGRPRPVAATKGGRSDGRGTDILSADVSGGHLGDPTEPMREEESR